MGAFQRATAWVDPAAVQANCEHLAAGLADGAELCAVVKSNAYGHGMPECARAALAGGADRLAVVAASEAFELREQLPEARLLTMGALTDPELDVALSARSELSVWHPEFLEVVADRGAGFGVRPRVHVKFDTGMGRLGNKDEAAVEGLLEAAAADDRVELVGLWTHFATADDHESEFFDSQLERFGALAEPARERFGIELHAANSAATLRGPASHFDLVRCGVAIYGMDPFGQDPSQHGLRPAMGLSSYLADVKRFEPGESAGYGCTWTASEPTWVGVIPIGYGDGIRRGLSNNSDVLVAGRRHPLVGTISMDNLTVDLGPSTEAEIGDEAVLLGSSGEESIGAEEMARRLGTINYEISCGISPRVPRIQRR